MTGPARSCESAMPARPSYGARHAPDEPGRARPVSGVISEGGKSGAQALMRRRRCCRHGRPVRCDRRDEAAFLLGREELPLFAPFEFRTPVTSDRGD